MDESAFVALVAEILEVDPATVSLTDRLDDLDWDSLANISFIAEIDTRLSAQVDADELANATTVADLKALVDGVAKVPAD